MAKVQEILSRVRDNGYVYEGTYEGWYLPALRDFKAENEIDEGKLCPIHHIELTREQEDSYFFKLSAFQERLRRCTPSARTSWRRARVNNESLSFMPLRPARCAADTPQADVGRTGALGLGATSSTCGSTRC